MRPLGNRRDDGQLVCYDRREGKFVSLADEETRTKFLPLAYLEAHQAFLLARAPKLRVPPRFANYSWRLSDNFRFLDPVWADGSGLELMKDKFPHGVDVSLWSQELPRRLQPALGKEHVVWAAIPKQQATQVGAFDTKHLRWLASEWIPNLEFQTKDLWVDEDEQKIYLVYKGHLLRLPLPERLWRIKWKL